MLDHFLCLNSTVTFNSLLFKASLTLTVPRVSGDSWESLAPEFVFNEKKLHLNLSRSPKTLPRVKFSGLLFLKRVLTQTLLNTLK